MAVRNGEPFLREALDSVLNQQFRDFELIVIDDCSDDDTPEILRRSSLADARIRRLRNRENLGLTRSLNLGLDHARGEYIARIDADDRCHPTRLRRQLEFLEQYRDYISVGCGFNVIDERGRRTRTVNVELDDWQIRWLGGFNPPAPHPTYFFRRVQPDGKPVRYDQTFRRAQDFDLWSRLTEFGKTHVLPDVLLDYRRHPGAITVTRRREQAACCRAIGRRNLQRRLPPSLAVALEPLLALFAYEAPPDAATIRAAVKGCDAMLAHDMPRAPSAKHRRWIRRTTAGLLADAVMSRAGGLTSPAATAQFLVTARAYLLPLAMAVIGQPSQALKSLRAIGGR